MHAMSSYFLKFHDDRFSIDLNQANQVSFIDLETNEHCWKQPVIGIHKNLFGLNLHELVYG